MISSTTGSRPQFVRHWLLVQLTDQKEELMRLKRSNQIESNRNNTTLPNDEKEAKRQHTFTTTVSYCNAATLDSLLRRLVPSHRQWNSSLLAYSTKSTAR